MKQSIKSFMKSNPTLKELLEFQIEQQEEWLTTAELCWKEILKEMGGLGVDKDGHIKDIQKYEFLEFKRVWELSRIEELKSQIKSIKYKLKYV